MEKFVVRKRIRGKFRIALIYPNTYRVAMANLGFRLLYFLLNQHEQIYCERFTSDSNLSMETGSRLRDFDLLAFCYQYENDLLRIVELVEKEQLWNKPKLFGGPCTVNPFPIKAFADLVYVGEAEASLDKLIEAILGEAKLEDLGKIRGVYVPEIDNKVRRAYPHILPKLPPFQVSSKNTVFGDAFLLEVSRGCIWNCKFCMGRNIFAPYRERKLEDLLEVTELAMKKGRYEKLVLIAASIGSYSRLDEFCEELDKLVPNLGFTVSAPSLRADALNERLLELIVESGERTIALAPESNERLRYELGKEFDDQALLEACKLAKRVGIRQIKLYLMFGLPGESDEDLKEAAKLVNEVKRIGCLLYTSPSPRDRQKSRMTSSA